VDEAIAIRALKRFVTDRFGGHADEPGHSPVELVRRLLQQAPLRHSSRGEELAAFERFLPEQQLPDNAQGEKVAIIGSGPAGLAAAHDLVLLGLRPTVYEMEPLPAGMLATGIPKYRLPGELIAAEVDFIRAMGVSFVCNTRVGRDISLAEIRRQFRATIIAVGLKQSRSLRIPGSDGAGVLGGIEFLRDAALNREVDLRGNVVVIGGGNVAYDVARTVIRQTSMDISRTAMRKAGVESVHLCSLESLEELPADDLEIIEGDEEGVIRHHSLGPKEILLRDDGRVKGVVFQRCVRVFDEGGRFAPEFDESNLTMIEADTVIWSIGQRPDLSFLESTGGIELTDRGFPRYDPQAMRTTAADVFMAGDIAHGAKLLIHAVASGKQVARKVFEYVRGQKLVEDVQLLHLNIPHYTREQDYEKLRRTKVPMLGPKERLRKPQAMVEVGYNEAQAVCEGCRCLDCGVNTIFDSSKCILCGGCADICPESCLQLVSLERLEGGDDLRQTLSDRSGDAAPGQVSAIIKDETMCIRCSLCAQRCPTTAITMERVHLVSRWKLEPAAKTSEVGGP
jgi:NADPH-dependent glutamate synthase beta subunit-like oxidoreductase